MARFIKGEIVVLPFPFSDLSTSKRRPALVLAGLQGNDVILCQITSQNIKDDYAINLTNHEFSKGSLNKPSHIRPNRIFTADENIILYKVGKVTDTKVQEVYDKIFDIFAKSP